MKKKILLVDDDEQDLKIIKRYLSQIGNDEIWTVRTGEEGVKSAQENHPDITILDTNLPGIDGFETCKRIKEIDGLQTKVILMTGLIDAVDAGKARKMGADDYCVKTSDYAFLLNAVRKLN